MVTTILLVSTKYEETIAALSPCIQVHESTLIVPYDCIELLEDLEIPFKRRVIKL